jgi:hypothetical protein
LIDGFDAGAGRTVPAFFDHGRDGLGRSGK